LLPKLVSFAGCGNDELKAILVELGWQETEVAGGSKVFRHPIEPPKKPERPRDKTRPKPPQHARKPAATATKPKPFRVHVNPDSPFAGLAALLKDK
jgi:hypothetical protein